VEGKGRGGGELQGQREEGKKKGIVFRSQLKASQMGGGHLPASSFKGYDALLYQRRALKKGVREKNGKGAGRGRGKACANVKKEHKIVPKTRGRTQEARRAVPCYSRERLVGVGVTREVDLEGKTCQKKIKKESLINKKGRKDIESGRSREGMRKKHIASTPKDLSQQVS